MAKKKKKAKKTKRIGRPPGSKNKAERQPRKAKAVKTAGPGRGLGAEVRALARTIEVTGEAIRQAISEIAATVEGGDADYGPKTDAGPSPKAPPQPSEEGPGAPFSS